MVAVNYDWDELEDNIDEEYDDAGVMVAEYTTEPERFGNLISQRRSGESSFFHFDGLGSAVALSTQASIVSDSYSYTAFGIVTEQSGGTSTSFKYVGRYGSYKDDPTEGYWVRRRGYSSGLGTWLSADPLVFGSYAHKYTYVHDRLTLLIDISGLQVEDVDIACSCEDALSAFLQHPPAEARECIRRIRRCNIHIHCAPTCGTLSGITWAAERFVHICLSSAGFPTSYRMYFALILHECTHAKQILDDNRTLCREDTQWPPTRAITPPGLTRNISCRECKDAERPAYRIQARFLFPDPPEGTPREVRDDVARRRAEFIAAGLCASCRHVCPEYTDPCPPFPMPIILLPSPLPIVLPPPAEFAPPPVDVEPPELDIPLPNLPPR